MIAQGRSELTILSVVPTTELAWDKEPRTLRVGICNSMPPPAVPQGRYRFFIYFPTSKRGHAESGATPATLQPGYNEVNVGPWIPGLENHLAACNDRPFGEFEIQYDGSGSFQPLLWPDGRNRTKIQIQCGGNYP